MLSEYDLHRLPWELVNEDADWFTAQLLRLIFKADPANRARLAKGFPDEVAIIEFWGEIGGFPGAEARYRAALAWLLTKSDVDLHKPGSLRDALKRLPEPL